MLKSSLIYQVWSAWWIRGAGEHRPQCDEIRLQTVQCRLLCIYHGPNRLGSNDKPSKTRRSLIPTLSWSAGILISFFSNFFLINIVFEKLNTARVLVLFSSFFRKLKRSGACWLIIWSEHMRFLTVCRVSPANQWEEHSYSQQCICQLKLFRKPRLQFILINRVNGVNRYNCYICACKYLRQSCTFCLL